MQQKKLALSKINIKLQNPSMISHQEMEWAYSYRAGAARHVIVRFGGEVSDSNEHI